MSKTYDAMRFSSPSLEELERAEDEARECFGSDYDMDLVKKMTEIYDEKRQNGELHKPLGNAPLEPVELAPFVNGKIGSNYDSSDELYEQLTDGSAVLRFAAFHEDLNPEDVDLWSVDQNLERVFDFESDRPSKEEHIETEKEFTSVWNQYSNTDISQPLKTHIAEVPLEMENADFFIDKYQDVLGALSDVEDISIDSYSMRLDHKGRNAKDLDQGLRGEKEDGVVTKLNFNVSYDPTNRVEEPDNVVSLTTGSRNEDSDEKVSFNPDRQKFTVGITNGTGLQEYDKNESAVRVLLNSQGPGEHRPKADEMTEALKNRDIPVENWNINPE